ncbi:MAG: hypothetical protein AB4911_13430, partial [Oscillochloridaceae bacterium umkhey_bin13]
QGADEPAASPASSNVPAWLQGADEPAASPASSNVPAWLQGADEPAASPASSNVPAWLQGADEPAASSISGDVPAWLQGTDEPAASSTSGDVPDPVMPDWLQGDTPPAPTPAPIAGDEMPPWLMGEESPAIPGAPSDPGLPAWLRGIPTEPEPSTPLQAPSQPPRRPAPAAEEGQSHAFLSGAELPSWLRIPEPERPAEPVDDQELGWLRRLGGNEADDDAAPSPSVVAVTVQRRPTYARTAEQLSAIALLQHLTQQPYPEPAAPPAPVPLTRWQRIGLERVLYALLIVALLIGLSVPVVTSPFQTATPVAPGADELSTLLATFDSEAVALVAYEWAAQRSAELRPLETAVTSRLITNRTRMILLSTDIQGTLLSFDLIGPLREAGYNNENGITFGGRDYVLLGYRPGGELALRRLAQDLRGELRSDFDGQDATTSLVANLPDGTPRFTGVGDVSLIVVMADAAQDVQAWMEQIRPAARNVPIVFLIPQEVLPLAQPYLRQPGVYFLAGQQGALALQALDPNGNPAAMARSVGMLGYTVAIFLVLLLGGVTSVLIGRARTKREVSRER